MNPIQQEIGQQLDVGPIEHTPNKLTTILAASGMAAGLLMSPLIEQPAYADTAQVVINMPFSGKWAYNANVNPPYTDANSSHPSVHEAYGFDWATDIYAAAGTEVNISGRSPNGAVTFKRNRTADTCSKYGANIAGQGVVFDVRVNGNKIGEVKYDHLDLTDVGNDPISSGTKIGVVTSEPLNASCFQTRHTHVQLKNTSGNYACYSDHGHPGASLSAGTDIGVVGSSNNSTKQACASVPSGDNGDNTPPPKDSTQMILNHAEEIWAKNGVGVGGWTFEAAGGSAVDIASGGGVQMILDHAGQVWARQGIGGDWIQETGPNSAVEIEVGSDGVQMLRNGASEVWVKQGVGWSGWIQETNAGAAKDIETNGGVQVILNYANQLWVKNTIGWGGWQPESGENGAVEIEVSNDGTQMVRNAVGEVWARANTANSGWVQEAGAGSAAEIAINNGIQLIRDNADQVLIKTGAVGWGGWQPETATGSAVEIVVEDDGTQVLRDHADAIYARSTAAYSNWVQETGTGAAMAIAD
jgi:hypothetical protein